MNSNTKVSTDNVFDVRYIRLHFTIVFTGNFRLPVNKVSAIRGGVGEMLLRANCVSNRQCDLCGLRTECLVQRIMYSEMAIHPKFMISGDSVGYVYECEDYRDHVDEGDQLQFTLMLFGKSIVYFSQYLQAIAALGQNGIGKYHATFVIASVTNSLKQDILSGSSIFMKSIRS